MAELRVVVRRAVSEQGVSAMFGRLGADNALIWMSFTALDFTRMAGGAPMLLARWRYHRGQWERTDQNVLLGDG